jgi:cobalt/nickel transport system permease protein
MAEDRSLWLIDATGDSAGPGWMERLDARLRIVTAVLFALVTVSLDGLSTSALALAIALVLPLSCGLSPRIFVRLLPLAFLMLVLLLTLPFSVPGETIWRLGGLAASAEGLQLALLVLLKANAVALALLVLVGTLEPAVLGHALGRLGVPDKLVALLLLTVRQIQLITDEYRRLRQALRARAFVPRSNRHTWRTVGWLMGMLLVRSLARSRRVLDAMRLRGWQGRLPLLSQLHWRAKDSLAAVLIALLLGLLLAVDHLAAPLL